MPTLLTTYGQSYPLDHSCPVRFVVPALRHNLLPAIKNQFSGSDSHQTQYPLHPTVPHEATPEIPGIAPTLYA